MPTIINQISQISEIPKHKIVPEKQNTPIIPNVWSTKTQGISEEEGDRNDAVRPSFQMKFEEQMFPDDQ